MTKTEENAAFGCMAVVVTLGIVALVAIWGFVAALIYSWVLVQLWQWFVVTTFGLKALTLAQAYGVMLVIGFLRLNSLNASSLSVLVPQEKKTPSYYVNMFLTPIITAFITLGIGYFVFTQFIR